MSGQIAHGLTTSFTPEALIAEARNWIGTPWQRRASLKGVGADCVGFVRGVVERFIGPIAIPTDYATTWHLYGAEPVLEREVRETLRRRVAQGGAARGHAEGRVIHCYREVGAVVEQDLSGW